MYVQHERMSSIAAIVPDAALMNPHHHEALVSPKAARCASVLSDAREHVSGDAGPQRRS